MDRARPSGVWRWPSEAISRHFEGCGWGGGDADREWTWTLEDRTHDKHRRILHSTSEVEQWIIHALINKASKNSGQVWELITKGDSERREFIAKPPLEHSHMLQKMYINSSTSHCFLFTPCYYTKDTDTPTYTQDPTSSTKTTTYSGKSRTQAELPLHRSSIIQPAMGIQIDQELVDSYSYWICCGGYRTYVSFSNPSIFSKPFSKHIM